MDIEKIKENYSKKHTEDLLLLLTDLSSLRSEILPILEQELISRGNTDDALVITNFLESQKQEQKKLEFEISNIYAYIGNQLNQGNSLDKVRRTLDKNGIQLFEILNNKADSEKMIIDYKEYLKTNGVTNDEIENHISFIHQEIEQLRFDLGRKGSVNSILGAVILVVGILLTISTITDEYSSFSPKIGISLIIIGMIMASRGFLQKKA